MRIYLHAACQQVLLKKQRVVVSRPNDPWWPRDADATVLYCVACHRPVDVDEVNIVEREEP